MCINVVLIFHFSVQTRLNSPEGMNFTEFTYQMFQAYDWLHLYRQYNCLIQVSDLYLLARKE